MRRTRQRPIPSGRMTPKAAFEFGLFLSIFGFLELWFGANLLTAMLGRSPNSVTFSYTRR